jgi:hypothetical protein
MNKFAASTSRSLLALCLFLAVALLAPCVSAQQQVGYVLEMSGKWLLAGNSQLANGRALPAGGVISVQSPTQDDYIVIVNLKGDIMARRSCRNSDECGHPIKLPRAIAPEPSTWSVLVSSVMGLLGGEPDRYSIHRKRDGDLPDNVVQLKDGQLDLSPVFERKGKGRYYLRLRAIPHEGKPASGKWIGPLTLDWDQTKLSTVSVSGLKAGLYELALLDRDGDDYLPAGASAWILASRPDEYSKTSSSFQEAVALTRKWGSDVTPEGIRSFLRAQLDRMAAQAAK